MFVYAHLKTAGTKWRRKQSIIVTKSMKREDYSTFWKGTQHIFFVLPLCVFIEINNVWMEEDCCCVYIQFYPDTRVCVMVFEEQVNNTQLDRQHFCRCSVYSLFFSGMNLSEKKCPQSTLYYTRRDCKQSSVTRWNRRGARSVSIRFEARRERILLFTDLAGNSVSVTTWDVCCCVELVRSRSPSAISISFPFFLNAP